VYVSRPWMQRTNDLILEQPTATRVSSASSWLSAMRASQWLHTPRATHSSVGMPVSPGKKCMYLREFGDSGSILVMARTERCLFGRPVRLFSPFHHSVANGDLSNSVSPPNTKYLLGGGKPTQSCTTRCEQASVCEGRLQMVCGFVASMFVQLG
jgi:hypothetical protein